MPYLTYAIVLSIALFFLYVGFIIQNYLLQKSINPDKQFKAAN